MPAPWTDLETLVEALRGVETVLMVSAAEAPDRVQQHLRFVDAAAQAGIRHLVYTSFVGAAPDAVFTLARDHHATEEHIKASGLSYTLLRDNLHADFLAPMVGDDGVLRGPAGDGRVAAVARDDVADVAAAVLKNPSPHAGQTYELTGPQSLTLHEVAAAIAETTGRDVRYQPETIAEAYGSRESYNAQRWELDAWVSTYTSIAAGELEAVTSSVDDIAGHPATSLRDLLRRS